jgi:TPR repeat protein
MSNVQTRQILGLMLAAALAATSAGCSKQAPKETASNTEAAATTPVVEAPKTYQEGVEAYQAGKFDVAAAKFKELADKGDPSAQFNLGSLYHSGQGVTQDDKQAALLFAKAAEQGHTDAMDNLGLRYAKGEGVEQDWVQAYKWFSIAGMRKNASAASNAKVALSKMTPEKIDQAQNQAKEWMGQHPKK